MDIGLYQSAKRLQLRDHDKAKEKESGDQVEESEEQTSMEEPRVRLRNVKASIRILINDMLCVCNCVAITERCA